MILSALLLTFLVPISDGPSSVELVQGSFEVEACDPRPIDCRAIRGPITPTTDTVLRFHYNLKNVSSYIQDFFVLVTADFVIAPTDFEREPGQPMRDAVPFSQVVGSNDMNTFQINHLAIGSERELAWDLPVGALIAKQLKGTESKLWPWVVRVDVSVVDRARQVVLQSSEFVDLIPPVSRLGVREKSPNQSLERTRWARSIRFAGQQFWRAAQLQIR